MTAPDAAVRRDRTLVALAVWVPETLHTSGDLLVLVDQSSDPVASLDVVDLLG